MLLQPGGPAYSLVPKAGVVRAWDVRTGAEAVPGPADLTANGIPAVSADGRRLLTFARSEARVIELAGGKADGVLLATGGFVRRAAFSPDGARVVTLTGMPTDTAVRRPPGGEMRVWDAETGQPITPPRTAPDAFSEVNFSPDGRRVLLAGRRSLQVWDTETALPVTPPLPLPPGPGNGAARWADDGRVLVKDGATLAAWDVSADRRPADELRSWAQLLTGQRIDESGSLVPLTAAQLAAAWDAVRPR
jgi:WD40 repeat protein